MSFAVVTRIYIALCFIFVVLILETRACWRAAVDPSAAPQFSMYDPQHKNCTLEEWETHLRRAGIGAEFANLWARGRTVQELRQALGKPQSVEGPIDLKEDWTSKRNEPHDLRWIDARTATQNWIYDMGNSDSYLLVSINRGRCTSAMLFDYAEHLDYQDWKAEQIIAFAQRRTTDEILQKFGPPERISDPPRSGGLLSYVADKAWRYDTGYSTAVLLYIHDCRCIGGEQQGVLH